MKVNWQRPKKRPKKRLLAVSSLLSLALIFTVYGWLSDRGSEQPNQEPTVSTENQTIEQPHIALLACLSGPFRREGEMLRQGVELAWKELQAEGVKGKLIVQDGGKDPAETVRLAKELAHDPEMLFTIAHLPMSSLSEIVPIFEQQKVLLLVPAASHQNLVAQPWILPFVCSDQMEGTYAAGVARTMANDRDVAVIFEPEPYGELLSFAFQEEAQKIQLQGMTVSSSKEDTAVEEAVTEVLQRNPAVIWLAGSPLWGVKIVNALMEKQYQGRFLVPRSYGEMIVENLFGKYLDRLYILRPALVTDTKNGSMRDFSKAFRKEYWREPNWLAALGYDAMRSAGKALEKGQLSRQKIRRSLLRYNSPRRAYQGVAGPVYFDENRNVHRPMYVTVYRNGRFTPVPDL